MSANANANPPPVPAVLQAFFAHYPTFTYDTTAHPSDEFDRLVTSSHWARPSKKTLKKLFKLPAEVPIESSQYAQYASYWNALREFKEALVGQFHAFFGSDVGDYESWKRLCVACGYGEGEIPETVAGCKKLIKKHTYVNLVDLVFAYATNTPAERFGSLGALRNYTKRTDRIFPKRQAKGTLLKFLLRGIF